MFNQKKITMLLWWSITVQNCSKFCDDCILHCDVLIYNNLLNIYWTYITRFWIYFIRYWTYFITRSWINNTRYWTFTTNHRIYITRYRLIEYTSHDFEYTSQDFENTSQDYRINTLRYRKHITRYWTNITRLSIINHKIRRFLIYITRFSNKVTFYTPLLEYLIIVFVTASNNDAHIEFSKCFRNILHWHANLKNDRYRLINVLSFFSCYCYCCPRFVAINYHLVYFLEDVKYLYLSFWPQVRVNI